MLLLYVPVDARETAKAMARILITEKAAACVNISGPLDSLYTWEGVFTEATEWILWIKSVESKKAQLLELLKKHHPYTTPCIGALSLEALSPGYLSWVQATLDTPATQPIKPINTACI